MGYDPCRKLRLSALIFWRMAEEVVLRFLVVIESKSEIPSQQEGSNSVNSQKVLRVQ